MTIYYLSGGEDIQKRTSIKMNKNIFLEAGINPIIFVFPWSKPLGFFNKYRKNIEKYFLDCGAKQVIFADENKSFEELKKEITNSKIVYLPGGNTKWFIENAKKHNLKGLLKKFPGTIMGNSARTMILGTEAIGMPNDNEREYIEIIQTLGILPITTTVHFTQEQYEMIQNKKNQVMKPIYCIPENQAIRIEKSKVTLMGKGIKVIS